MDVGRPTDEEHMSAKTKSTSKPSPSRDSLPLSHILRDALKGVATVTEVERGFRIYITAAPKGGYYAYSVDVAACGRGDTVDAAVRSFQAVVDRLTNVASGLGCVNDIFSRPDEVAEKLWLAAKNDKKKMPPDWRGMGLCVRTELVITPLLNVRFASVPTLLASAPSVSRDLVKGSSRTKRNSDWNWEGVSILGSRHVPAMVVG